jgi:hypothetical protein
VLALAAPVTGQYLQQNVSLARFDARQPQLSDQAEVRLASAETGETPRAGDSPSATPAPQRAVATPAAPIVPAARPEVRRASLTLESLAPASALKSRQAAAPRREADRMVRAAARDELRTAPREERIRTSARDERRAAPARTTTREERRPAPVRTAARDERRPAPTRTAPARATTRTAAAPTRGASGRLVADRPARALRKDAGAERRRSNRD